MAKTLDFTTKKKKYLTVKLNDDEKTVLAVNTPTKAIFDVLLECSALLNDIENTDDAKTEEMESLRTRCLLYMRRVQWHCLTIKIENALQ